MTSNETNIISAPIATPVNITTIQVRASVNLTTGSVLSDFEYVYEKAN